MSGWSPLRQCLLSTGCCKSRARVRTNPGRVRNSCGVGHLILLVVRRSERGSPKLHFPSPCPTFPSPSFLLPLPSSPVFLFYYFYFFIQKFTLPLLPFPSPPFPPSLFCLFPSLFCLYSEQASLQPGCDVVCVWLLPTKYVLSPQAPPDVSADPEKCSTHSVYSRQKRRSSG